MSTKSREVIFGSRIRGAKIHADGARERAKQAVREADRAEAEAWSIRMEDYCGPAQPSPTIGECLNGGLGWLEVECNRCIEAQRLGGCVGVGAVDEQREPSPVPGHFVPHCWRELGIMRTEPSNVGNTKGLIK